MKPRFHRATVVAVLSAACTLFVVSHALAADVHAVAGNGTPGFSGDGGAAVDAQLESPQGVCVDAGGNLFIADSANFVVRRVDGKTSVITTIAGTPGVSGDTGDGGPATSAELAGPLGIACGADGSVYIADQFNSRIRRVDASGMIDTVAGNGVPMHAGDGGPATAASLWWPQGVAVDASGNLFIAETQSQVVRRVDAATGTISTLAGIVNVPLSSGDGGLAVFAGLAFPTRIAVDAESNIFIGEQQRVRRIDAAGIITTVAGGGTTVADAGSAATLDLGTINDVAIGGPGDLLIGTTTRVWSVDLVSGIAQAVAGTGVPGSSGDGGAALLATFNNIGGVTDDGAGGFIIADSNNHRVRGVSEASGIPFDVVVGLLTEQDFLDSIDAIEGGLLMVDADGVVTLVLPNLETVGNEVIVTLNDDLVTLDAPLLVSIGGGLMVESNPALGGISLPGLTSVDADVSLTDNSSLGSVDFSGLGSIGGDLTLEDNDSLGSVDLGGLGFIGGDATVSGNDGLESVDLSGLGSIGGDLTLEDNDSLGSVDLSGIESISGGVDVTNNIKADSVDLSGVTSVGGDLIVAGNSPATVVSLPGTASIAGSLTLETLAMTLDLGGVSVGGSTSITTDAASLTAQTASGATTVTQTTALGSSTLSIPAGATESVTFIAAILDPSAQTPEAGTSAGGNEAVINPIAATDYTVPGPLVLGADVAFTIDVTALSAAEQTEVLDAHAAGILTLAKKVGDGVYEAFPVCGAGQSAGVDGCAEVVGLDAAGDPTAGVPESISLRAVTTTFSTWAAVIVYDACDPAATPPPGSPIVTCDGENDPTFSPGDCNADGGLDISDGVCLLGHLFQGVPARLPCGNGSLQDPANVTVLDSNGDRRLDLSEAVRIFGFLFLGDLPPVLGRSIKPLFPPPPVSCLLHRRPPPTRSADGSPSPRRWPAAAARSKAQRGIARSGHAAQDGLR